MKYVKIEDNYNSHGVQLTGYCLSHVMGRNTSVGNKNCNKPFSHEYWYLRSREKMSSKAFIFHDEIQFGWNFCFDLACEERWDKFITVVDIDRAPDGYKRRWLYSLNAITFEALCFNSCRRQDIYYVETQSWLSNSILYWKTLTYGMYIQFFNY